MADAEKTIATKKTRNFKTKSQLEIVNPETLNQNEPEIPSKEEKVAQITARGTMKAGLFSAIGIVTVAIIAFFGQVISTQINKPNDSNIVPNYQEAKMIKAYDFLNDRENELNQAKDEIQEKIKTESDEIRLEQLEVTSENITNAIQKTKNTKNLIYTKTASNIQNLKDNKITSLVERDEINKKLVEEAEIRRAVSVDIKNLGLKSLIDRETVLINKGTTYIEFELSAHIGEDLPTRTIKNSKDDSIPPTITGGVIHTKLAYVFKIALQKNGFDDNEIAILSAPDLKEEISSFLLRKSSKELRNLNTKQLDRFIESAYMRRKAKLLENRLVATKQEGNCIRNTN